MFSSTNESMQLEKTELFPSTLQSNTFDEFFKELNTTNDLNEYDFEHAATPPLEVLNESYDLSDDELQRSFLSEISCSNYGLPSQPPSTGFPRDPLPPPAGLHQEQNLFAAPHFGADPSLTSNPFHNNSAFQDSSAQETSPWATGYSNHSDPYSQGGHLQASIEYSSDAMSQMSLQDRASNCTPESLNSLSNLSSPGSFRLASEESKSSRKCLADLTDEEKYHRIRVQNNIASREYRNRKKGKQFTHKQKERELEIMNEKLKEYLQDLERKYETCVTAKAMFEKVGYSFHEMNLT